MTQTSIAVLNVLFWPVVQVAISVAFVRLPSEIFMHDVALLRAFSFEESLRIYRALGIDRWKKRLPDGGRLVGAAAKRVMPFHRVERQRYIAETKRSEAAHWLQLSCGLLCWLWNPPWAAIVMCVFGMLVNAPCILAQRYNRIVLQQRG